MHSMSYNLSKYSRNRSKSDFFNYIYIYTPIFNHK
uniref:Uncharacterized protein n=1 Tax=Anguilla anguilla TaxID=7936 RepID=A0A0E9W5H9_ANGAN